MTPYPSSRRPSPFFLRLIWSLWRDCRGTPIIEMALLLPLLLMFMMGILVYGQYFLVAHSVQQAANDGGRAALAGLDAAEREQIARKIIDRNLATLHGYSAERRTLSVNENGQDMTLHLTYTLPKNSLLRTSLVPVPSHIIQADATFELQED